MPELTVNASIVAVSLHSFPKPWGYAWIAFAGTLPGFFPVLSKLTVAQGVRLISLGSLQRQRGEPNANFVPINAVSP